MSSVILNLTRDVDLKESDPLLGVLPVDKLLFYDELSVEKFPSDRQEPFLEKLLQGVRNKLENRTLSKDDDGENFRILVLLGFDDWLFLPHSGLKALPAFKVGFVVDHLKKMCSNALFKRLDFYFVLIDSPKYELSGFYCQIALDGYFSRDTADRSAKRWIAGYDLKLEDVLLPDCDENDPVDSNAVYKSFKRKFNSLVDDLCTVIHDESEDLENDFREEVRNQIAGITTVGQFCNFGVKGYKSAILESLSFIFGLKRFSSCRCFSIPLSNVNVNEKLKCEIKLKSLLQFLCTISSKDEHDIFESGKMYCLDDGSIAREPFDVMNRAQAIMKEQIMLSHWNKEEKMVTYTEFSPTEVQSAVGSNVNDSFAEIRQELTRLQDPVEQELAGSMSKIPFFFGKDYSDTSWYNNVIKNIDVTFIYELEKNSAINDNLTERVSETSLKSVEHEVSYSQLENIYRKMIDNPVKVESNVDYDHYVVERQKLMDLFDDKVSVLKRQMVKLGFMNKLLPISIVSTMVVMLYFIFHFFYFDFEKSLIPIASCFVAVSLLFVLSSVIAQRVIRNRIIEAYYALMSVRKKLSDNLADYLSKVAQLSKELLGTYIYKRNLEEVEEKQKEFDEHNKRFEIWRGYLEGMGSLVRDALNRLQGTSSSEKDLNIDLSENVLESKPFVPWSVSKHFENMNIELKYTNVKFNRKLEGITSFCNMLIFRRYPN